MKTAIYPGTFDPITYGHIDVIKKSLKVFDRVIVATTDNVNKNYYFSIEERLSIIKNSLFKDLRLNVTSFMGLFNKSCKEVIFCTLILLNLFSSLDKDFISVNIIDLPSLRISLFISNTSEKINNSNTLDKSVSFKTAYAFPFAVFLSWIFKNQKL